MFRSKRRMKRSENSFRKLDVYDLPNILKRIREANAKAIREADAAGCMNEWFGPEEIILDNDESDDDISEMNTCAGITWMAAYRVISKVREVFGVNTVVGGRGRFSEIDIEASQSPAREIAPSYHSFDLGPKTRRFTTGATALAPNLGKVFTYKVTTTSGVELDILEVEIQDHSGKAKLFQENNDFQAQILSEKCASLLWILEERTQIILVTESSGNCSWSPQQWFRKILCDMTLADSIMIGHPFYWHPIVKRRLTKALKHFKKLYKTISEQTRIVKNEDELAIDGPVIRTFKDYGKIPKFETAKYKYEGKSCVKVREFYPHTRTRVLAGNYVTKIVHAQPMADVADELFQDWGLYREDVNAGGPFIPLEELIQLEEEKIKRLSLASKNKQEMVTQVKLIANDTNTPNADSYQDVILKALPSRDSGIVEVIGKEGLFEKNKIPQVHLHATPEITNFGDVTNTSDHEIQIQIIKSAENNFLSDVIEANPENRRDRDRDSVHSQSEGEITSGKQKTKSQRHKRTSKRHQPPHQGPSRSEGFLRNEKETLVQKSNRSRSPSYTFPNVESETFTDRVGHSGKSTETLSTVPLPFCTQSDHHNFDLKKLFESNKQSEEFQDDLDLNQLGDENVNALKLGPSKTRYHLEHHNVPSESEIGPPMPTFNEPFAMRGHVFGLGMQHNESEIPPADADSLSALSPHGLSSRERLPGVVNQLGLETSTIRAADGHTMIQQHRGGSGPTRNAGNQRGNYHAVTCNKSLESLDLGQPSLSSIRNNTRVKCNKDNGKRCSQCNVLGNPHHSS